MMLLARSILDRYGEMLRFLVSGGMAFFASISSLYFFAGILGMWYLKASVFSFIVAFMVSFSLQKFWTFRNKDISKVHTQIGVSLATAVVNLGFNTGLMYFFVENMHFHYLEAQIGAAGIIAVESFFIYKYLVFAVKK